jgi:hypothetical protein
MSDYDLALKERVYRVKEHHRINTAGDRHHKPRQLAPSALAQGAEHRTLLQRFCLFFRACHTFFLLRTVPGRAKGKNSSIVKF